MIKSFSRRFESSDLNGSNLESALANLDYDVNEFLKNLKKPFTYRQIGLDILEPQADPAHVAESGWQRVVRTLEYEETPQPATKS